jgi:hypothetical protein
MPTLGGIEIKEVHQVDCPQHGMIGVRYGPQAARALQRHHFEWRHQPNPEDRICLWRYPLGGGGYRLCVLEAGHLDWMHKDAEGLGFAEHGSLPREDIERDG